MLETLSRDFAAAFRDVTYVELHVAIVMRYNGEIYADLSTLFVRRMHLAAVVELSAPHMVLTPSGIATYARTPPEIRVERIIWHPACGTGGLLLRSYGGSGGCALVTGREMRIPITLIARYLHLGLRELESIRCASLWRPYHSAMAINMREEERRRCYVQGDECLHHIFGVW